MNKRYFKHILTGRFCVESVESRFLQTKLAQSHRHLAYYFAAMASLVFAFLVPDIMLLEGSDALNTSLNSKLGGLVMITVLSRLIYKSDQNMTRAILLAVLNMSVFLFIVAVGVENYIQHPILNELTVFEIFVPFLLAYTLSALMPVVVIWFHLAFCTLITLCYVILVHRNFSLSNPVFMYSLTFIVSVAPLSYYLVVRQLFATRRAWAGLDLSERRRQIVERQRNELQLKNKELEVQAFRDELTSIANRRSFSKDLNAAMARFRRHGQEFSIAIIDIDHFKKVNDTWGHQVGDEVLKLTADSIGCCLRTSDSLYRIGGEEFAVIAYHQLHEPIDSLLVRIQRKVADTIHRVSATNHVTISISMGVCSVSEAAESMTDLYSLADQALYRAKESRNKAVVYHQGEMTEID